VCPFLDGGEDECDSNNNDVKEEENDGNGNDDGECVAI
jgi:hypothetical protein